MDNGGGGNQKKMRRRRRRCSSSPKLDKEAGQKLLFIAGEKMVNQNGL
jgi:hypothetical protein